MNIFNIIKTTWAKSPRVLNVSSRKVGGITFIKVGRINVSFSISRAYRPIGAKPAAMCSGPFWDELEAMAAECRTSDGNAMVAERDR